MYSIVRWGHKRGEVPHPDWPLHRMSILIAAAEAGLPFGCDHRARQLRFWIVVPPELDPIEEGH